MHDHIALGGNHVAPKDGDVFAGIELEGLCFDLDRLVTLRARK